jgi:hypothetical protein
LSVPGSLFDDDTGTLVVTVILFANVCIDGDEQLKLLSCSTLITNGVVVDTSSRPFVMFDGDNELLGFTV